jgi:hypothetical protein
MGLPRYPSLYQINTRVWLTERSRVLGRPATLDDPTDRELDDLAAMGFDWIWLLSVWRTGDASRAVSRRDRDLRRVFEATLPDLREADIAGSGFAITGYTVDARLGGDEALARLRERLAMRGLRLMLDFVPNHTALDHPWVEAHPEYYVHGTELEEMAAPGNYTWAKRADGDVLIAHGRDPYFPGWTDTLQLDYSNPATQAAMAGELRAVSERCDGVRCDMAMLLLPDVFERTWGRRPATSFWPDAISAVRRQSPDFTFMAEVYWDLEWTMLQQGFDYAYDKRLYDRLRAGPARPVREHLYAGLDYQSKLARFLENHDEPRAAAIFPAGRHEVAGIVTFLTPGLRFFHEGQFEGRRIHISPHLVRAPDEPTDEGLRRYYDALLEVLRDGAMRDGDWALLECTPAWDGNPTWDDFIAWEWRGQEGRRFVIAVNLGPGHGQCYVRFPVDGLDVESIRLVDRMSGITYERSVSDLAARGLYLDLPGSGFYVFDVSASPIAAQAGPPANPRSRVEAATDTLAV